MDTIDVALPSLTGAQTGYLILSIVVTIAVLFVFRRFINILIIDVCILGDFTALRHLVCCSTTSRRHEDAIGEESSESNSVRNPNHSFSLPTENPVSHYLHGMDSSKKLVLEQTLMAMALSPCGVTAEENDQHAGEDVSDTKCSICLQKIGSDEYVTIKSCSHPYHRNCIHSWLQKSLHCPLCRTLVIPEDTLLEMLSKDLRNL